MIDYIQAEKPVYLIKDIVNPPYQPYYIVSADFSKVNERGYWTAYLISHLNWDNPEYIYDEKKWIAACQDELCWEPEAEQLISKLRHEGN
jgi:hypothetical protein